MFLVIVRYYMLLHAVDCMAFENICIIGLFVVVIVLQNRLMRALLFGCLDLDPLLIFILVTKHQFSLVIIVFLYFCVLLSLAVTISESIFVVVVSVSPISTGLKIRTER